MCGWCQICGRHTPIGLSGEIINYDDAIIEDLKVFTDLTETCEMPAKHKYLTRIENLGFGHFVRYMLHKKTGLPGKGSFRLYSRLVDGPLWCRGGTTDIDVFKHVFVLCEYAGIELSEPPDLIVDCGANAGFSTAYFLSKYPSASVVAVEPDPGNFQALQKNTQSFGKRCLPMQAGIWPKDTALSLIDSPVGDGREWAKGVVEASAEPSQAIAGISIPTLLQRVGKQRISFLKIDIEGGELGLFQQQAAADWLPLVDVIAIELHGTDCEQAYYRAVETAGFESVEYGGLTLSVNKHTSS